MPAGRPIPLAQQASDRILEGVAPRFRRSQHGASRPVHVQLGPQGLVVRRMGYSVLLRLGLDELVGCDVVEDARRDTMRLIAYPGHRGAQSRLFLGWDSDRDCRHWQEALAEYGVGPLLEPPLRKVAVVLNVNSGAGKSAAVFDKHVRPTLEARGIKLDVWKTQYPGHAIELAQNADFGDVDSLVMLGGDGIVGEVINGLYARDDAAQLAAERPVGVIPTGSDNSLVASVAKLSNSVGAAVAVARGTTSAGTDLLQVDRQDGSLPQYGCCVLYYGFMSEVLKLSEKYRRSLRTARYNFAGAIKFAKLRTYHVRVEYVDPETNQWVTYGLDRLLNVAACIHRCGSLLWGPKCALAPEAEPTDGFMHLIICKPVGRVGILKYLNLAKTGRHIDLPYVEMIRTRQARITPLDDERIAFGLDGEVTRAGAVELSVVPRGIQMWN